MQKYDPERSPDPSVWLALDEQTRIELALAYHKSVKLKLPNLQARAAIQ